jgi:hypothetical protein
MRAVVSIITLNVRASLGGWCVVTSRLSATTPTITRPEEYRRTVPLAAHHRFDGSSTSAQQGIRVATLDRHLRKHQVPQRIRPGGYESPGLSTELRARC